MTHETRPFQAEVSRLLEIVAHSLYSEKEIFLRELISNASDACDRLRYAALTEPALAEGDTEYRVTLTPDKSTRTLTIADNGIGMNREELIDHLGTIARSGRAAAVRQNLFGPYRVADYPQGWRQGRDDQHRLGSVDPSTVGNHR